MGAGSSADPGGADGVDQIGGWRVLQVLQGSPCQPHALVPHFDCVTHIDGQQLSPSKAHLGKLLHDAKPATLTIINFANGRGVARHVTVTPSAHWGGEGLLGLVVRYDHAMSAQHKLIHIVSIHPGGPACAAGLEPQTDYLLGTADMAFQSYADLEYWLDKFEGKLTSLFVFNARTRQVRQVWIKPDSRWSGKGSLGCDLERASLPNAAADPQAIPASAVDGGDVGPAMSQRETAQAQAQSANTQQQLAKQPPRPPAQTAQTGPNSQTQSLPSHTQLTSQARLSSSQPNNLALAGPV